MEKTNSKAGSLNMTTSTPGFIGQRLTEARCARGLSGVDLADLIDVSSVSISKYENGHQTPKIEVLHKIASTLNMPRAYFLRPCLEDEQNPIFWRAKLSVSPVKRDRAEVRLQWMKEIVDYLGDYFDFPSLNMPFVEVGDINGIGLEALEDIANKVRNHWGVRPGPMPDVIEKLESNGILVSRIHVGAEKLDAFSQWSNGIPHIILSRDKASAARQRFDALHELSHIILHKNVTQKRLNDKAAYKMIEKQADQLASCLLLPAKDFIDELYTPSLDAFLALKERWGVSVAAMIMRCRSLKILDEEEAARMWINYTRRGWRGCEPLDGKMEKETPFMIKRSFEMLISEGVQSPNEIIAALPFPVADLEELTDLEPGTLSGINPRSEPILKIKSNNTNVISMFGKERT